jgi:pantoate--beta-alanine ligase
MGQHPDNREAGPEEAGSMKIIREPRSMQAHAETLRNQGQRIALVPTMGYLHEGHVSLMKEGKKRTDALVVSVFVNPTQFGPQEDLGTYPRDFEADRQRMEEVGVDAVFYPTDQEMYEEGYQTYVTVEMVTENLCGRSRPQHFRGVATVVSKLFNIVKPHVALFGEKDYQQLVVIRRMVADLNFDVEVVGCPIVREPDGLAMSSRNKHLNADERKEALALKMALDRAQDLYRKGETRARVIMEEAKRILGNHLRIRTDYISLCDGRSLTDVEEVQGGTLLAIAAFVGNTRLIDNCLFRP